MSRPGKVRVASWIIQLFGIYILFVLGIFGRYDHIRVNFVYCILAFIIIGWGRAVYLPEVKLLKSCPFCGNQIRKSNKVCPHCQHDLDETLRFPGVWIFFRSITIWQTVSEGILIGRKLFLLLHFIFIIGMVKNCDKTWTLLGKKWQNLLLSLYKRRKLCICNWSSFFGWC